MHLKFAFCSKIVSKMAARGHISPTLFHQQKAKPGEGMYADLGEFHQKAPAPSVVPVKMPPQYEKTEYAEISQFLRGPVKSDDETTEESKNGKDSSPDKDNTSENNGKDSSPDKGDASENNGMEQQEFLVEI